MGGGRAFTMAEPDFKAVSVADPQQSGSPVRQVTPKTGTPAAEPSGMRKIIVGVYIFLLILGVGTGYLLSRGASSGNLKGVSTASEFGGTPAEGDAVGIEDTRVFTDTAEGKLEAGGADGEGTHFLTRPGGVSQNVYLISSVVDLDEFVGQDVVVWGQTVAAQKAGWLMDVGKIAPK